ncbi:hypothetical protein A1O3_03606 [Capronia epimyces CBS 606.96]|uniref:RING-CH-type domain-containing protein n=1 Tax=Capronia epimyces CBS 606.96 TaxID=1182542 RepID=W9Y2C1_9EURO|nr:uncharacterized protein A1O3_03606 [Capronia epimyces CBS 606.96]EXJ86653.1 hypothetical protein A1O3_03606 [Capronia epimyces CBS 606.96]
MDSEDLGRVSPDVPSTNPSDVNADVANPDSNLRPPPLSRSSTFGSKKCWICMSDTTEDDPHNPPVWRSPCQCSLTAHEACLLDWVADLENPKNGKRKASGQILCPQCKSEIKISRPKSYIVDTYRSLDRALGKLVFPGLGLSVLTSFWAGAWAHGFYSVYLVFGEEDAARIFEMTLRHPAWNLAYGLIPINLIFSRTNYSDFVLPTGSLLLLATQTSDEFKIDMTIWPPLPSTVFACLPSIRSAYNWCYHKAFCDLNKKWLEEIQPSHAQQEDGNAENDEANQNLVEEVEEGGVVLELQVNLNAEPEAMDDAPGEAGGQQNGRAQPQNGHVHQILGDRGDRLVEGTSGIGQMVVEALAFPAVAAGMGTLLSFLLPSSWLSDSNQMNGRPGLLRTKWGRSVVGGGLFVVLKDALVLYCRWKLAKSHRQRRILNYDKKSKRYSL